MVMLWCFIVGDVIFWGYRNRDDESRSSGWASDGARDSLLDEEDRYTTESDFDDEEEQVAFREFLYLTTGKYSL